MQIENNQTDILSKREQRRRQRDTEQLNLSMSPRRILDSSLKESISVIIPLYNEEESLVPLSDSIKAEAITLVGNN